MSESWSAKYVTGIHKIDAQHRYLFRLADKLARLDEDEATPDVVKSVLEKLQIYAREHFTFEEDIMREAGCNFVEEHCHLHRQLKQRLERFAQELAQGKVSRGELSNFMRTWIKLHIIWEDMRYVPVLRNRAQKA